MIQDIIRGLKRDYPILISEEIPTFLKDAINSDRSLSGKNMLIILMCIYHNIMKYDSFKDLHDIYLKNGYFNGKYNNLITAYHILNNLVPEDKISNVEIISDQLDEYEKMYGWHPYGKYLVPNNGNGVYAIMLIKRLMDSPVVKSLIPDELQRYKYILERMVYVTDFDSRKNFTYISIINTGLDFKHKVYYGDFLSDDFLIYCQRNWNTQKFTAIFIEPPVKNDSIIKKTHSYVYHKWIIKAQSYSDRIVAITPARWLQTDTSELKYLISFRESIKNSGNLRILNYTNNVNTELLLNGGVCKFLLDKKYNGKCLLNKGQINLSKFDIILTDSRVSNLILKLQKYGCITDRFIGLGSGWTGIKTNDSRLQESKTCLKVHVTKRKSKNEFMYINSSYLNTKVPVAINHWKVFTPETATSSGKGFANKFIIAEPYELCNQSFCVFLAYTQQEAESMISYFRTNFANKIVGIRKIKNHINEFTLKWLPIVPFDRIWTDEEVNNYFKLTKEEQKLFN